MSESDEAHQEYSTLTVVQLRKICKRRGLQVGGIKKEIVERLIDSDNDLGIYDVDESNVGAEGDEAAESMADHGDDPVVVNDSMGGGESAADDNNDGGNNFVHDESPTAHDETESAATTAALHSESVRSGIAEDAELLAELKAISNKSSSGRFQDEEDVNHDDVVLEAEQLDQNCSNNDNNHNVVVTDADENVGDEFDEETEFDDDAFLPNATTDAGDFVGNENDSGVEVEENVANEQLQQQSNDGDEDDGAVQQQEVIDQPTQQNLGIKSNLPNTFNGKNGGTAEDADLLAELRAISNKASGGRFDDGEDGNNNDTKIAAVVEGTVNETVSTPSVEETAKPWPSWKQEKNTSKKTSSTAVDVVVASAPTPAPSPATIDPFENALCDEKNVEPQTNFAPIQTVAEETSGIKSNLPNTFNGKNGGVAEDADLLAELKAISNKASGGRFDDGEDGNNNDTKITALVEGAVNETASTPSVEESAKPLPPWKLKKKISKKASSTAFDVDVVVASAPAPAPATIDPFENALCDEKNVEPQTNSAPIQTVAEEISGIKSNLPNTFNGKNGGVAEDADLLAELKAISNKASGGRFDDEDEFAPKKVTEKPNDAFRNPPVEEKKSSDQASSRPLPPWKQKRVAEKKQPTNSFDVDVVVASAPTPAAVSEENNKESATAQEQQQDSNPPTENNFGIKSNLPNTFNGKNGGAAEDADLLAELRAISNKTSASRFDSENDDANAQPASKEVESADVAVVNENVAVPSAEEDTLPPWKRKNVVKANTSPTFDVDVVVAAAPVPAVVDPFQNAFAQSEISEPARVKNQQRPTEANTGIKSSLPNTCNGKNGGVAEDADLLAELRAISNKASGNRFDGEEVDDNAQSSINEDVSNEKTAMLKDTTVETAPPSARATKSDTRNASGSLPPWKRKGAVTKKKASATAFDVDVVVTAPPALEANNMSHELASCTQVEEEEYAAPSTEVVTMGVKSSLPNTFNGKNGGAAEDADLLAELRAISNKSSVNRFDEDDNAKFSVSSEASTGAATMQPNEKKTDTSKPMPPWKQKRAGAKKTHSSDFNADVVVAAPPAPVVDAFENATSDESFITAADEKDMNISNDADEETSQREATELPAIENMGMKSTLPNTFNGKNGGIAEDADLLAELRAISNKASGGRFEGGDEDNVSTSTSATPPVQSHLDEKFRDNGIENVENSSKSKTNSIDDKPWKKKNKDRASGSLPPWKVKREKNSFDKSLSESVSDPFQNSLLEEANPSSTHVVFAPSNHEPKEENMGIKSSLPNTFKGKNGGSAEDADLLAELRAISMKNSSNRFSDDGDDEVEPSPSASDAPTKPISSLDKPWQKNKQSKNEESRPLPPWMQKGAKKNAFAVGEMDVTIAAAAPSAQSIKETTTTSASEPKEENMGIKSQFTNTFKGDRGGAAEDADLLAELRAISKNSSSNRFVDTEGLKNMQSQKPQGPLQAVAPKSTVAQPSPTVQKPLPKSDSVDLSAMNPFPTASAPPAEEINITLDGLDESLASSNWQIRKASYQFLQEKIQAVLSGREPLNQLSGDDIYSSLDSAITKALGDKNAGALDSALTLSLTYSDCCEGACSEETASRIMSLLLKGAAFASSRPSTLKSTQELVFKLVEVAPEGSSTADDAIDLIQQHGLKAKKPKVVKFAASLVLQLIQEFGTGVFDVSKLSAVHETLVGNSNDKIRAVGMEVLAELCRTLGSKTPLQALVDKLKKSQQSQLDSLLDKQPTAKPPSRRLRCMRGVKIVTQSPEEALAALKKREEEEKLKRFATRPAVNLLHVLPQTCYADKIKEAKWSEKVAALNALIEAGGEQPYKILNGNYTPLLRELKQLLSHTHYLVCSKALAVIGMLAEGVGEPISSDLRYLLPTIVPLFKDKKVGKAVMSCLDQMFGNALRFDHFLDSNDSFLSSLDEKKEKNALVRKSVLEFLTRCIVSSGTRGTCGTLTSNHAQDLCKISCDKLKDSDASTRKAATDVLVALLNNKDEVIVSTAEKATSSLQSSNPRAFKTLSLATKGGKPDASKSGGRRPGTAPSNAMSSQSNKPSTSRARPTTAPRSKTTNVPSAPARNIPSSGAADEKFDEDALPSLEESIDSLSELGIPQWGDDADSGGVLAGIQSSNWKQRMVALNNLATHYETNGGRQFSSVASLFVLVKACTKAFQESNFNVAKAILELCKVLFNIYADRQAAPEAFLYVPVVKLAAEKIGDRKLSASSSSCLDSICIVKDPQRVLQVATKAVDGVKSPLVHEALLVWIKSFSLNFGLTALSQGVKDVLFWILKECESNNMKVKNAARDVLGEMYTQLGPVLESFVKSSNVSSSVSSMVEKAFKDSAYDPKANQVERKMKCITMSSSNDTSGSSGKKGNASSMLALPTTDLMSALKSDCLDRMNDTGDKKSWRNRKEALDEVNDALGKSGGLLSTERKAFQQLKQLAENLRLRLNDSQSNLKPVAASVIGLLLSHLDDTAQAKIGSVVFPALVNAAMNDIKKTMRDAAVLSLELGTERPKQNGGGTNAPSVESFILSLESELSDAAIKSSGLPDVLEFLTAKMETLIATSEQEKLSVHRPLAKVIVRSLLSPKSGSRSAAESLLAACSKNNFVPSATFDKEIGKLSPAQQRTVRSFIPKMSKQDQELVDTFKKASERPRRPGQMMPNRLTTQVGGPNNKTAMQSTRGGGPPWKSNNIVETSVIPENPLQMINVRSAKPKGQRLALLGKSDSWPEYSEEPSSDTIQALRKSWSAFIPSSSIDVLLPQSGLRTHEDCISGCDLLSKAIGYSRDNNDSSFLDLLDFIFKWATCAILLRNHTSGFRKLLSTIHVLFERLDELSYVISDAEALLLLPYLVDKAGVAKLQFKEEILTIFTLVTTKKVYPSQKFGSVCIKVLEKSKSNPSRSLAAELCSVAVQSTGVSAIGKKGLVVLSNALNEETVAEAKKVYIDLFEIVVEKLRGDTGKLFSAINPTDKVKAMIMERCAKQPVATHGSPRRSPPRKIAPPVSQYSPTNDQEAPALSSSAVVTGNLRARLQKSKETKISEESHRLPPVIDTSSATSSPSCHTPRTTSTDTEYNGIMTDINWMTQTEECKSTDIVRGTDAIHLLRSLISNNENSSIDHIKRDAFREKIESDYNTCLRTVASALEFAFDHGGKHAQLPSALINETVSALSHLLRMDCKSKMSQDSVEKLVNILVSALLDERIHINHEVVKATNKVAMRAVVAPPLDSSLNALISVQVSILDPMEGSAPGEKYRLKFSRVLEKLLKRIIKDRNESSLANPFGELKELGPLLASIDWIIETIEEISRAGSVPEELLTPSKSMTRYLLLELVKCKKGKVRETVNDLGDDVNFIQPLLSECEQELGMQPSPPAVASGDSTFRERLEALKRQRESNGK